MYLECLERQLTKSIESSQEIVNHQLPEVDIANLKLCKVVPVRLKLPEKISKEEFINLKYYLCQPHHHIEEIDASGVDDRDIKKLLKFFLFNDYNPRQKKGAKSGDQQELSSEAELTKEIILRNYQFGKPFALYK